MPVIPRIVDLGAGWHQIDSGYSYDGHAAVYLLEDQGRCAIFDVAHNGAQQRILAALDHIGVKPPNVDLLFISHAHLDHCGGAGTLIRLLPNARLVAHQHAVPHLIEPARLIAGARQIYADRFDNLYGRILPIASERVTPVGTGDILELGSRKLKVLNTPGHAFHHICVVDPAGDCIFAGDTFGIFTPAAFGVPEIMRIPAAPTQFSPAEWKTSINQLIAQATSRIFVTHFGAVTNNLTLKAADMCAEIDHFVALARAARTQPDPHLYFQTELADHWYARLGMPNHSLPTHLLSTDLQLNAMGLELWMNKHLDNYDG